MKIFIAALLFAVAACAEGDDLKIPPVSVPRLAPSGANAEAFAPKGWVVEAKATGDLNGDGKPDLAFVLHDTDKRNPGSLGWRLPTRRARVTRSPYRTA
jgi:hypothetical protein